MQSTAIFLLIASVSTALAGPWVPVPPAKPAKPAVQTVTINCGGGTAYCCNVDSSAAVLQYTCSGSAVNCNAITICCSNNAQNDAAASQACASSLGGPIVWK